MTDERTTVSMSVKLAERLHDLKSRGDTYEDVIWRLLEEAGYEKEEE